jgi:hypothetical protein
MDYKLGTEGDELYSELLTLFEGLERDERDQLFAKLTLALMNEIGDRERIRDIFMTFKR